MEKKIKFFINNSEISEDVNIMSVLYTDSCDGVSCDNLEIDFSNSESDWEKWNLEINSEVKVEYGTLKTETLFVDDLKLINGGFRLSAKTIPLNSRSNNLEVWESVDLHTIFNKICSKYNFSFEQYETENHKYERLERGRETDLTFLTQLAYLEGYSLKIYNKKMILINDEYFEKQEPILTINKDIILNEFDVKTSQNGLLSEVVLHTKYGQINYKEDNLVGDKREIYDKFINNYAEGLRFAKGFLKKNNLDYLTCEIMIEGNFDLSSGVNIELKDFGEYDGIYTIKKITSRIDNNFFMMLSLRRVLK